MSKKRKKNNSKPKTTNKKKKMSKDMKTLIGFIVGVVVIIGIIAGISIATAPKPTGLEETHWKSVSAYDKSGKEVDITKVYNNYYSSYQGSMFFSKDMTFTFWMSAGDPQDGTHSGNYTYDFEKDVINAEFDNGDEAVFKVVRNEDDSIKRIEAPYNDYTIWFVSKY